MLLSREVEPGGPRGAVLWGPRRRAARGGGGGRWGGPGGGGRDGERIGRQRGRRAGVADAGADRVRRRVRAAALRPGPAPALGTQRAGRHREGPVTGPVRLPHRR